jgi:hypothetical protein
MSININRYVNITSGVGASSNVTTRDLVGRLFTDSNLLPPNTFIEFDNAADVATFFGSASEEAARATFYFAWLSKNITQPQSIQYARWVNVAVAPMIYSISTNNTLLANWTTITTGSFGLTIDGVVNTFTALDFSAAASLSDVASILQTAIHTKTGTMWTSATVTYDTTRKGFIFTGGQDIDATISVQAGATGVDITIASLLGWLPAATFVNGVYTNGALTIPGSAIQTITATLTASVTDSNNFGSFLFLNNLGITLTQAIEAATWNFEQNNMYLYTVPVTSSTAAAWAATDGTGLGLIGGTALTLAPVLSPAEYPEQVPMMIEAATNYLNNNVAQNYMFQTGFLLTPSVTSDTQANTYDALRVNYYGSTQSAGVISNFYQRGVLMGTATSPLDMNTYINEIWLKDAAATAIMNLLLSLNQIPANAQGRLQILTTLQSVINQALNNGTISVNKALSTTQQMYITQATNDPNAWYQVQTIGYWVDCQIVSVSGTPITYKATYTLIYSKDDVIRLVTGTDILI